MTTVGRHKCKAYYHEEKRADGMSDHLVDFMKILLFWWKFKYNTETRKR